MKVNLDAEAKTKVERWFALHGAACQAAGIVFVERAGLEAPVNRSTAAYVADLARIMRASVGEAAASMAVALVRNCQRTGDYRGAINGR